MSKKLDHQYSDPNSRWPDFDQWKEDYIRRHADNPSGCSCWMCQNPRRVSNELTMQEKRFEEYVKCESLEQ